MDFAEISPFALSFVLVFLVLLISKQKNKNNNNNNNLPPGPWKLPFIGNMHQILSYSDLPHYTLSKLAKKYGPLMHLQLGEIPTIVISSSETAELFLKTHEISFATRPSLVAAEVMSNGNRDIAFAPYGEYWRQLRKICTLQLLGTRRVRSFRPIRENEITGLCRWMASQSGSTINLTEKIVSAIYDITTLSVFGSKTADHERYTSIIRETGRVTSGFSVVDIFPSVKLFGKMSGLRKKMEGMYQETENIMLRIIDERKSQIANSKVVRGGGEKQEDLLDVLLQLVEEGREPISTTKDIVPILQDMFGGGIELSLTTIDWAMSELLKNPNILKKAQDEVRQVFDGKTHLVDEFYFNELKYLKLVIKETFRMHPPVVLLPRECREQCTISGYNIPQKTRLLVNAWAISKDPKYWKDPYSFEPERFLDIDVDYKGTYLHFTPFGAGRRSCPGISFGLANIELSLAMFLYHFDWVLPKGVKPEEVDMTEKFGNTVSRKSKLFVVPIVRRPIN